MTDTAYEPERFIAHAGGQIRGGRYTNSMDAFLNARHYFSLIECDVVMGADGPLIAHDGLEANYGLQKPFSQVSTREFATCRYNGQFTTAGIGEISASPAFENVRFVLDVKGEGAEYLETLRAIRELSNWPIARERFVVQVYSPSDFEQALSVGFGAVVVAFWKKYHSALNDEAFSFLQGCLAGDREAVIGVSLHMNHLAWADYDVARPGVARLLSTGKVVYLHGQSADSPTERVVRAGFGLFTHLPFQF